MVFHCWMAGWVCMSFLVLPSFLTLVLVLRPNSFSISIRNLIKYAHIFVQRVNRKKPNQSFVLLEYVIWKIFHSPLNRHSLSLVPTILCLYTHPLFYSNVERASMLMMRKNIHLNISIQHGEDARNGWVGHTRKVVGERKRRRKKEMRWRIFENSNTKIFNNGSKIKSFSFFSFPPSHHHHHRRSLLVAFRFNFSLVRIPARNPPSFFFFGLRNVNVIYYRVYKCEYLDYKFSTFTMYDESTMKKHLDNQSEA